MIRESEALGILDLIQMEKCINRMKRKELAEDELIIEGGKNYKEIIFVTGSSRLESESKKQSKNVRIYGDCNIWCKQDGYTASESLISSESSCVVYILAFDKFFESVNDIKDFKVLEEINKKSKEIFTNTYKCKKIKNIGDYEYLRSIGSGGYGYVFLGLSPEKKLNAVKVIPKKSINSNDAIKMIKVRKLNYIKE